jgi:hypothetical protein
MFAETITTEPSLAQAVWDHSRLSRNHLPVSWQPSPGSLV